MNLKHVLTDGRIQLGKEAEDWRSAIRMASDPLLKEGCIGKSYVEAMIRLVETFGAYVVIAKGVALAHARPESGVRRGALSVLTLRTPVAFGNAENDPVSVVFCLAAEDDTSHLEVIRSLVNLIDDPEKVRRLAEAKTLESFRSQLAAADGEVA